MVQYGISLPRSPPIEFPTDYSGISQTTRRYDGNKNTAGIITTGFGDVDPLRAAVNGTAASNARGVIASPRLLKVDVPVHGHHAVAGLASVKASKAGKDGKGSKYSMACKARGAMPGQPRSFLSEHSAIRAWGDDSTPLKKFDREEEEEEELSLIHI